MLILQRHQHLFHGSDMEMVHHTLTQTGDKSLQAVSCKE